MPCLLCEHQVLTIPVCWTESSSYDQHSASDVPDRRRRSGADRSTLPAASNDGRARRSVRIGEALVTVSNDVIKINRLTT